MNWLLAGFYLFIAFLHGYNNHMINVVSRGFDPLPMWTHILSGILWPISAIDLEGRIFYRISIKKDGGLMKGGEE